MHWNGVWQTCCSPKSSLAANAAWNSGWFCWGCVAADAASLAPVYKTCATDAALSVEACILCFPTALAIAWLTLLNSYVFCCALSGANSWGRLHPMLRALAGACIGLRLLRTIVRWPLRGLRKIPFRKLKYIIPIKSARRQRTECATMRNPTQAPERARSVGRTSPPSQAPERAQQKT